MKICFLHRHFKDVKGFLRYARLDERLSGQLEWDETSPDILIASEWIYYRSDLFRKFRDLYPKSGVKVAYLGEAIAPDFNLFDYAIGFSDAYRDNERYIRILSPFDMFSGFLRTTSNELDSMDKAEAELGKKTGFCNFLYSNPCANPMRDKLFLEIGKYKRVDSLGRHLNNVSTPGTGYSGHSKDCTPMKSKYKFSIASENSDYKGYTSEKIITSLEAHTVPIYWGNPDVVDDINPACFINVNGISDFDELRAQIERIDNDNELWCRMVSQPWLTEEQSLRHMARTEAYRSRLESILDGESGKKLPEGYHIYLYRKRFFDGSFPFDSWKDTVKSKLGI